MTARLGRSLVALPFFAGLPAHGGFMKPFAHLVVAGLVLLLTITPSWGQPVCASPGCNPTVSGPNNNTGGGTGALLNVVTSGNPQGFNNTAFGFDALLTATTGQLNTAIGSSALKTNIIGTANTAVGGLALFHNTGSENTAVGANALEENTTGSLNTATGNEAMLLNTTGSSNTATGAGALRSNTSGIQN